MTVVVLADRYDLGELIGRGGMADVHAAVDQRLERDVAVKIVRPNGHSPADLGARFEDEARIAAGLQHPNVVAVYDTGVTDENCPFIVMERLPGETLADRVRQGPLPEPAVRVIAEDVLGALAAAHAAGVVHRDVKPGNILLTADGRAKIADFGIARESDSLLVDPTTTNALTGTPAYLAPERIEGRPATARTDIWALGVVLYEALAGRKPFEGATPLATAMAVRDQDATPLQDIRPDVDPALASVVMRAMSRDPMQRYATAAEMAAALHVDPDATRVDGTMTLIAPPPAMAAPWGRRVPMRAVAIAAAALAAVLLLIAIGLAAGRDDEPRRDTPANPAVAETPSTTAPRATTTTTIAATGPAIDIQIGGDGADGADGADAPRQRDGKRKGRD